MDTLSEFYRVNACKPNTPIDFLTKWGSYRLQTLQKFSLYDYANKLMTSVEQWQGGQRSDLVLRHTKAQNTETFITLFTVELKTLDKLDQLKLCAFLLDFIRVGKRVLPASFDHAGYTDTIIKNYNLAKALPNDYKGVEETFQYHEH